VAPSWTFSNVRRSVVIGGKAGVERTAVSGRVCQYVLSWTLKKDRAGSARPEATSAARIRALASLTALSGNPTMAKCGKPGATCTCTSTARASMPSNATVLTRWTCLPLALKLRVAQGAASVKNI